MLKATGVLFRWLPEDCRRESPQGPCNRGESDPPPCHSVVRHGDSCLFFSFLQGDELWHSAYIEAIATRDLELGTRHRCLRRLPRRRPRTTTSQQLASAH